MTASPNITHISSRENPQVKLWRRLAQETHAYRKNEQLWLEGEHLCSVVQQQGKTVQTVVLSHSRWQREGALQWLPHGPSGEENAGSRPKVVVLDDAIFADVSGLESAAGIAYVLPWQGGATIQTQAPTVVLDRLQDAGNVGAILRCAAAFGFHQVVALHGTAGLWSPKVLRAGMGAHWSLHLVEQAKVEDLSQLNVPLLLTSSHDGAYVHQATLPWPCAWVMGHEGQGVSEALSALKHIPVRIAQPGGQESLNVATAAAICLHASAVAQLV